MIDKAQIPEEIPMFVKRSNLLPDDVIYALTWTIPDDFGGLTNVLLHRSKQFAELGHRPIDILTLAPNLDVDKKARQLFRSGHRHGCVRLRNFWAELQNMPDRRLRKFGRLSAAEFTPEDQLVSYEGQLEAKRRDPDGKILQVDRFRTDGSRVASDRRDEEELGMLGGRRISLFDRSGDIVGQWKSAGDLYLAYLDYVIKDKPAFLINDSGFVSSFLHKYQRDNVTTVQVIHSAHLSAPESGLLDPLLPAKVPMFRHLERFDLVAPLTERQAQDIIAAGYATDNVHAVPNSRPMAARARTNLLRNPKAGIMVTRLSALKQVDHAIEAIAIAYERGANASLHIYGSGKQERKLRRDIQTRELQKSVFLKGYDPHGSKRFNDASFSILTSKSEGMGLAVVESMAAGCIPIAYDIRYGPGEIIKHGKNGFLVPSGDVGAVATAIEKVVNLSEAELSNMRRAAIETAMEYSDGLITGEWGRRLAEARDRKSPIVPINVDLSVDQLELDSEGFAIFGCIACDHLSHGAIARLSWMARDGSLYGRLPLTLTNAQSATSRFEVTFPVERTRPAAGGVLDLYLDVTHGTNLHRIRIPIEECLLPDASDQLEVFADMDCNLSIQVLE